MSSKHTPGPWKWSGEYTHPCGKPAWTLLGRHGLYGILTCDQGSAPQDLNDEANARLIAAAPELLEALVAAVYAIEQGGLDDLMCCDGRDCGCRASTNGDLLAHDLRAAIAKATGGAA